MEGKGTPKNEQNQFCHSPSVKAMTPSEVEGQDSHAAGVFEMTSFFFNDVHFYFLFLPPK